MSWSAVIEDEFVEANFCVVVCRLLIGGLLWCIAVSLLDNVTADGSDPYVANLRLGLWLFLAELLVALYRVRYTAPESYPLHKRAAFIAAESIAQTWNTGWYVATNLVVRWITVTLLTAACVWLFGTSYLNRLAAIIPSGAFFVAVLYGISETGMPPVIRGTHLGSYAEAIAKAAAITMLVRRDFINTMRDKGFDTTELLDVQVIQYPFGGVLLPFVSLAPHYLFLATTGSGKTLCIRMLLNAALRPNGELRHRAMLYDGKQEYYSMLIGMGVPAASIHIMNPADARCTAWDIAADIHNKDDADNVAVILIPDDNSSQENPFFINGLRSIISEVMMSLHSLSPKKWRLIDVINAVRTPDVLKRVLKTSKEGEELMERYFTDAVEAVGGMVSTIDARFISQYGTIARVWARCTKKLSMTDWIKSRSVILLGFDANAKAVDRINQAIFKRASMLLCSLPENSVVTSTQSWIVLDEVRFTGKLPQLPELMSFGRSKGVRVIIAPQDLDGLVDVYGEQKANEMMGLCGNVGVMQLTGVKTREWASKFFGEAESWEIERSHTVSQGGSSGSGGSSNWNESWGSTTRRVKREAILPSEFLHLPPTDRLNGLHGFFFTKTMGAWRAEIPPTFLDTYLPQSDPEARSYVERSAHAADPLRWTPEQESTFTTPPPGKTPPGNTTAPSNPPPPSKTPPPSGGTSNPPNNVDDKDDLDPLPDW